MPTLDTKERFEKDRVTLKYLEKSTYDYCNKDTRDRVVRHLNYTRQMVCNVRKLHALLAINYKTLEKEKLDAIRAKLTTDPRYKIEAYYKKTLEYHLKMPLNEVTDLVVMYADDLVELDKKIAFISDGLNGDLVLSDVAEAYRKPAIYYAKKTGDPYLKTWEDTGGYVVTKHPGTPNEERKSIHIRFSGIKNGQNKVKTAQIILHEAAHKFAAARDEGYAHDTVYKTLDVNKSLRNADSISFYILSLALKKCIDSDDLSKDYAPKSDCHMM